LVIAKAGKSLVRLVPVGAAVVSSQPGHYKGKIRMAADFDQTPQKVIRAFEDD